MYTVLTDSVITFKRCSSGRVGEYAMEIPIAPYPMAVTSTAAILRVGKAEDMAVMGGA